MSPELIASILQQYGSLGLVVAVAGYALRYLHAQLVESLEKRVSDAQASSTQLLKLADEQHAQMDKVTGALTAVANNMSDGKDEQRELRAAVEQALQALRSAPRRPGV